MAVLFYLFKIKAWLISRLPFSLLYLLSDVLSYFLRDVARYRKQVIYNNLKNAFPDKSEAEISQVAEQYYRNLADIILEVIKLRSIRADQLLERFRFTNYSILEDSFSKGKSIIVGIGHCGNWEWMGTALGRITPQKGYAVVKPLSDERFNGYMEMLRHRLNPDSTIPFKDTFRFLLRNSKERMTFNVFAADQTPTRDEINYWTDFLNQDTPFFLGIERIAKALDFTVVFIDIAREGRGRYNGTIHLITDEPKSTAEHEIMEKYIRHLEVAIRQRPDNWLWSHRRWKHKRDR